MKSAPFAHAFGITEDDVTAVLRANSLKVANTKGMPFEAMGEMLLPDLDQNLVAQEALRGNDLDKQTEYAHDEIHRQLWEKGVIETAPPIMVKEVSRPRIIQRLIQKFTGQDPFTMERLARAGFKGFDKMTDAELTCEGVRFGIYEELNYHFLALGETKPAYVHGHWTHIFGPGTSDTTLRIAYDTTEERLLAGQFQKNGRWIDLRKDDLSDVEDSLKNANWGALECPADAGLEVSRGLPDWACVSSGEVDSPRERQRDG
jgi:hypothetical protein